MKKNKKNIFQKKNKKQQYSSTEFGLGLLSANKFNAVKARKLSPRGK